MSLYLSLASAHSIWRVVYGFGTLPAVAIVYLKCWTVLVFHPQNKWGNWSSQALCSLRRVVRRQRVLLCSQSLEAPGAVLHGAKAQLLALSEALFSYVIKWAFWKAATRPVELPCAFPFGCGGVRVTTWRWPAGWAVASQRSGQVRREYLWLPSRAVCRLCKRHSDVTLALLACQNWILDLGWGDLSGLIRLIMSWCLGILLHIPHSPAL